MRAALRLSLASALVMAGAFGQSSNAYLVIAPGFVASSHSASDTTIHIAGGAEAILGKGVGVGGEAGYFTPARDFSQGLGVPSVNLYYHFLHDRNRRVDPFVTGGYSLLFRNGTLSTFNFGGGANIWLAKHAGVRAEFRDHVDPQVSSGVHYIDFRVGVSFR